jgi:hypothetical protein
MGSNAPPRTFGNATIKFPVERLVFPEATCVNASNGFDCVSEPPPQLQLLPEQLHDAPPAIAKGDSRFGGFRKLETAV